MILIDDVAEACHGSCSRRNTRCCWEVEEVRKGESVAREREDSRGSYDRSREIERSDPRDGQRGDLEGSLEMIDTRTV